MEADLGTQKRLANEIKERGEEELKRINQDWTTKYQNLVGEYESCRRIGEEKMASLSKE